MFKRGRALRWLFVLSLLFGPPALAQEPGRPVRFVVGFGAGGPTDVVARSVAQDLTAAMGQPFIVDNRPGANAIIATEFVARAAPDGHTMLFSSLSLLVNAILPGGNVKYDPFKDFAPISNAAVLPIGGITNTSKGLHNMQHPHARPNNQP